MQERNIANRLKNLFVDSSLTDNWNVIGGTRDASPRSNFTWTNSRRGKRLFSTLDRILFDRSKLTNKQASRPILVRGLRQDLRKFFLHQIVKVSVAQLVEQWTGE